MHFQELAALPFWSCMNWNKFWEHWNKCRGYFSLIPGMVVFSIFISSRPSSWSGSPLPLLNISVFVPALNIWLAVTWSLKRLIHKKQTLTLTPKHAARGVAQSPYPTYKHGKACLSKQPPWRAAGDPRLARGRSRVRALGPAGALRALFFSTLPSFLLWEIVFFAPSPPNLWNLWLG